MKTCSGKTVTPESTIAAPKNHDVLGIMQEKPILTDGKCHCMNETPEIIYVDEKTWQEWQHLLYANSKEWCVVGNIDKGKVTNYMIPLQENTGVTTEIREAVTGNLHVHSHHKMGAFWSATDKTHLLSTWEYCIVLSTTGYKAVRKIALPCGGSYHRSIEIMVVYTQAIDKDELEKKLQDKTLIVEITQEQAWSQQVTGNQLAIPQTIINNNNSIKDIEMQYNREEEELWELHHLTEECKTCNDFNCTKCTVNDKWVLKYALKFDQLPFCFQTDCQMNCKKCKALKAFEKDYMSGPADVEIEQILIDLNGE